MSLYTCDYDITELYDILPKKIVNEFQRLFIRWKKFDDIIADINSNNSTISSQINVYHEKYNNPKQLPDYERCEFLQQFKKLCMVAIYSMNNKKKINIKWKKILKYMAKRSKIYGSDAITPNQLYSIIYHIQNNDIKDIKLDYNNDDNKDNDHDVDIDNKDNKIYTDTRIVIRPLYNFGVHVKPVPNNQLNKPDITTINMDNDAFTLQKAIQNHLKYPWNEYPFNQFQNELHFCCCLHRLRENVSGFDSANIATIFTNLLSANPQFSSSTANIQDPEEFKRLLRIIGTSIDAKYIIIIRKIINLTINSSNNNIDIVEETRKLLKKMKRFIRIVHRKNVKCTLNQLQNDASNQPNDLNTLHLDANINSSSNSSYLSSTLSNTSLRSPRSPSLPSISSSISSINRRNIITNNNVSIVYGRRMLPMAGIQMILTQNPIVINNNVSTSSNISLSLPNIGLLEFGSAVTFFFKYIIQKKLISECECRQNRKNPLRVQLEIIFNDMNDKLKDVETNIIKSKKKNKNQNKKSGKTRKIGKKLADFGKKLKNKTKTKKKSKKDDLASKRSGTQLIDDYFEVLADKFNIIGDIHGNDIVRYTVFWPTANIKDIQIKVSCHKSENKVKRLNIYYAMQTRYQLYQPRLVELKDIVKHIGDDATNKIEREYYMVFDVVISNEMEFHQRKDCIYLHMGSGVIPLLLNDLENILPLLLDKSIANQVDPLLWKYLINKTVMTHRDRYSIQSQEYDDHSVVFNDTSIYKYPL